MLSWFSFEAIKKEIKGRIRWPKAKEMVNDSQTVILFILLFAAFFIFSDFLIALFLKAIGLGV